MGEPTYRQHQILEKVQTVDEIYRMGNEPDMDNIWELVRGGYLQNLVCVGGGYDWKFILTEQAEQYLSSFS